jgi:hypothetical protein
LAHAFLPQEEKLEGMHTMWKGAMENCEITIKSTGSKRGSWIRIVGIHNQILFKDPPGGKTQMRSDLFFWESVKCR